MDCDYARITIPLTAITSDDRRHEIAEVFGVAADELETILREDPAQNRSNASFGRALAVRLVDGAPCLVWEDFESSYGTSLMQEDLIALQVPFLRYNAKGDDDDSTLTAFRGRGKLTGCAAKENEDPIITPHIDGVKVFVAPSELRAIRAYLGARAAVLGMALPAPRNRRILADASD